MTNKYKSPATRIHTCPNPDCDIVVTEPLMGSFDIVHIYICCYCGYIMETKYQLNLKKDGD